MALLTVNAAIAMRDAILTNSALTALVGTRIYVQSDPPAGYRPTEDPAQPILTGAAIVITHRGGSRDGGSGMLVQGSLYVRCYAVSELAAMALDAVLARELDGYQSATLRSLTQALTGQPSRDPAGWAMAYSTWNYTST